MLMPELKPLVACLKFPRAFSLSASSGSCPVPESIDRRGTLASRRNEPAEQPNRQKGRRRDNERNRPRATQKANAWKVRLAST